MWSQLDRPIVLGLALGLAAMLGLIFLAGSPLGAAPFGVADEDVAPVVEILERRFEVLVLSGGYVLRPRADRALDLLEVTAKDILADGEVLTPGELAKLVGEDAPRILALRGGDALARLVEPSRDGAEGEDAEDTEIAFREEDDRRIRTETRVSFGGDLTVEEDESAREVVLLLGSLVVLGEVRGDTAVVGGSADIDGDLGGDLTVVGGGIDLGPEARVEGEVTSVGGRVRRHPDARVEGAVTEVAFAPLAKIDVWPDVRWDFDWPSGHGWRWSHGRSDGFDLARLLFNSLVLAFFVLLCATAARQRVGRIAERVVSEPFKAGFIGLVTQLFVASVLVVGSIILAVSLVGIPLLILLLPFAFLALAMLLVLGYTGVAQAVGRVFSRSLGVPAAVLVGLILIQMWRIFGETLSLAGGFFHVVAYLIIFLGFFIKYLAWTVGLGAVVLDRFSPRLAG